MTAYDNRDEEHAADDDRPDFPGIVSPEMAVSQPASQGGDQCRQDRQDQEDGQSDAELVNDV